MKITDIQFFDLTREHQTGENSFDVLRAYSANIVVNDSFIVQLAGCDKEAEKPSIPRAVQQAWKSKADQDHASDTIDIEEIENLFEREGIENNFDYLSENCSEKF